MINPLLEGIDGSAKMSKSLGDSIGLDTPPRDMFGLATRVPDALVGKYFRLATDVPDAEIERLLEGDIWSAKKAMAEALVARHHGEQAARAEREEFERVFRDGELPEEIPEHGVDARTEWTLTTLVRTVFGMSGGEAGRLRRGRGDVRAAHAAERAWGCDAIQGFHLSKPVPADEFPALHAPSPARACA